MRYAAIEWRMPRRFWLEAAQTVYQTGGRGSRARTWLMLFRWAGMPA